VFRGNLENAAKVLDDMEGQRVFKGFDQGFDQTLTMSWPRGVVRVCR
jgi:hypothetical protein